MMEAETVVEEFEELVDEPQDEGEETEVDELEEDQPEVDEEYEEEPEYEEPEEELYLGRYKTKEEAEKVLQEAENIRQAVDAQRQQEQARYDQQARQAQSTERDQFYIDEITKAVKSKDTAAGLLALRDMTQQELMNYVESRVPQMIGEVLQYHLGPLAYRNAIKEQSQYADIADYADDVADIMQQYQIPAEEATKIVRKLTGKKGGRKPLKNSDELSKRRVAKRKTRADSVLESPEGGKTKKTQMSEEADMIKRWVDNSFDII